MEELGKTLTDTGKEVATKAKALTETIQLKTQISTEKTKLEEAYAAIGRIYYESNREPEEAYTKVYDAVKTCRERIAALEIELTQSEGKPDLCGLRCKGSEGFPLLRQMRRAHQGRGCGE